MEIKSNIKHYKVIFESRMEFVESLKSIPNAEYVIDQTVYCLYPNLLKGIDEDRLFLLEAIEENKVIETALDLCEAITCIPAKRNATLVSIGGGIVQDITGFVANIIYRGIRWIYIPTTLLSACDSCIGGKTSLNFKKFKNLLGTFYPPDEIYICSNFFDTLTDRDYKSGLGEVVKFNLMMGENGLENMERNLSLLLKKDHFIVDQYIKSSLRYKKNYIEKDEFDKGERIKLNFAHTFGHSIEVASEYEIPHGTAVAIGMIMANRVSNQRNLLPDPIMKRIQDVLLEIIDVDIHLLECPMDEYILAIRKDKKQVDDALTAVLITKYGEMAELGIVHDMTRNEVEDAVAYFKDLYRRMV